MPDRCERFQQFRPDLVGRPFEFDRIAVGISEVDRRAEAAGSIALPCVTRLDAMLRQLAADSALVPTRQLEREMIHVACVRRWRISAGLPERRGDVDEIDQRASGSKLNQAERVKPPLDMASECITIKGDRAIDIGHAKHDMVETA